MKHSALQEFGVHIGAEALMKLVMCKLVVPVSATVSLDTNEGGVLSTGSKEFSIFGTFFSSIGAVSYN